MIEVSIRISISGRKFFDKAVEFKIQKLQFILANLQQQQLVPRNGRERELIKDRNDRWWS